MLASLDNVGSIFLTVFRNKFVVPLIYKTSNIVNNTRAFAKQSIQTRISIHPSYDSPRYTAIKTHVDHVNKKSNCVYLSNSIKEHNEFIPVAIVATGIPLFENTPNTECEKCIDLINYDSSEFQLRTFVFVSDSEKLFPSELLEPDMAYSSIKVGEFIIHLISTLWPYPSTPDGYIGCFESKIDPGPEIRPWTAELIVGQMRLSVKEANYNLSNYLSGLRLPRHGYESIQHDMSWLLLKRSDPLDEGDEHLRD